MNRLRLLPVSMFVISISVLSAKPVMAQSQTPGQIIQFDSNLNPIDSVITQDPSGHIGIGTTAPAAKLDVVGGNVELEDSAASTGNILKAGVPFISNFGINNAFFGKQAGNFMMTGAYNTAIGAKALMTNASGSFNTALGFGVLYSNTTGYLNTGSGVTALGNNTKGYYNTATGAFALFNNTTGTDNTATGLSALAANTEGYYNTATGTFALYSNTIGIGNTASGDVALYFNTIGGGNTASGGSALYENTTGYYNTAIGYAALGKNTSGAGNTAIGFDAEVSQGDLNNATAIGYQATVNASNKIRLGNSSVTVVEGPPYSTVSDRTKKENFKAVDAQEVLRKIRGLSVTSWNYIGQEPQRFRHYGPVAQDFFAAFGDDGVGMIGSPTTITSTDMNGVLMLAVQALGQQNDAFKAENAELKARVEALERLVKE